MSISIYDKPLMVNFREPLGPDNETKQLMLYAAKQKQQEYDTNIATGDKLKENFILQPGPITQEKVKEIHGRFSPKIDDAIAQYNKNNNPVEFKNNLLKIKSEFEQDSEVQAVKIDQTMWKPAGDIAVTPGLEEYEQSLINPNTKQFNQLQGKITPDSVINSYKTIKPSNYQEGLMKTGIESIKEQIISDGATRWEVDPQTGKNYQVSSDGKRTEFTREHAENLLLNNDGSISEFGKQVVGSVAGQEFAPYYMSKTAREKKGVHSDTPEGVIQDLLNSMEGKYYKTPPRETVSNVPQDGRGSGNGNKKNPEETLPPSFESIGGGTLIPDITSPDEQGLNRGIETFQTNYTTYKNNAVKVYQEELNAIGIKGSISVDETNKTGPKFKLPAREDIGYNNLDANKKVAYDNLESKTNEANQLLQVNHSKLTALTDFKENWDKKLESVITPEDQKKLELYKKAYSTDISNWGEEYQKMVKKGNMPSTEDIPNIIEYTLREKAQNKWLKENNLKAIELFKQRDEELKQLSTNQSFPGVSYSLSSIASKESSKPKVEALKSLAESALTLGMTKNIRYAATDATINDTDLQILKTLTSEEKKNLINNAVIRRDDHNNEWVIDINIASLTQDGTTKGDSKILELHGIDLKSSLIDLGLLDNNGIVEEKTQELTRNFDKNAKLKSKLEDSFDLGGGNTLEVVTNFKRNIYGTPTDKPQTITADYEGNEVTVDTYKEAVKLHQSIGLAKQIYNSSDEQFKYLAGEGITKDKYINDVLKSEGFSEQQIKNIKASFEKNKINMPQGEGGTNTGFPVEGTKLGY